MQTERPSLERPRQTTGQAYIQQPPARPFDQLLKALEDRIPSLSMCLSEDAHTFLSVSAYFSSNAFSLLKLLRFVSLLFDSISKSSLCLCLLLASREGLLGALVWACGSRRQGDPDGTAALESALG